MHPGGERSKRPFFLVAGMFGNVLNLRHLAGLLGPDRPCFGIQARGLYGGLAPHETFEDAARDYLAEVRQVQPHGPYLLGGFSGGGITAFEMVRQLRAAGEAVALLVLVDAPLPVREALTRADKIAIHRQRLRQQGLGYLTEWAKRRCAWELGKVKRWLVGDAVEYQPGELHDATIEQAFRRALTRYRMQREAVRVALFRPPLDRAYALHAGRFASKARELVLEDNGWMPYVEELEQHVTPGDHDSMVLEPNVRVLAARLRGCLELAERHEAGAATAVGAELALAR
jgi:thioesterase domain-containing protein